MNTDERGGTDVLLVEDDADARASLGQLLREAGYRVVAMADGREALASLRDHLNPRLILLDLMLPVMNGWVFRLEQQRDPRLATIPTILISGVHDPASVARYLNAAGHFAKPIEIDALLDQVQRFVRDEG